LRNPDVQHGVHKISQLALRTCNSFHFVPTLRKSATSVLILTVRSSPPWWRLTGMFYALLSSCVLRSVESHPTWFIWANVFYVKSSCCKLRSMMWVGCVHLGERLENSNPNNTLRDMTCFRKLIPSPLFRTDLKLIVCLALRWRRVKKTILTGLWSVRWDFLLATLN
jgi:hypothetical protein